MKRTLSLIAALGFTLTASNAAVYTLSGVMDPMQATSNPGNVGDGIGNIAGSYDDVTNLLDYTITWEGLSSPVTNMHFHLGMPGMPGGVELGIPGPWSSPQVAAGVSVDPAKEANLLAGNWYVNVHTQDFGGGEIRGQVNVTSAAAVPEPSWLLGSLIGICVMFRRQRRLSA